MTDIPPPISFGDYTRADLTAAGLALVRAVVEGNAEELDALTLDLDRVLLVGALLGPLTVMAVDRFGSLEGFLAWISETHQRALGEAS